MKRLIGMTSAMLLCSCSGTSEPSKPSDASLEVFAQGEIKQRLKDPESARFSNVSVYRGGSATAVCGYVNSRNSFGGMTGQQRFIVAGISVLEEEVADGGMNDLWNQFCR